MKVHTNNIFKTAAVAFVGTLLAATPSFAASISNGNFETATFAPEPQGGGFLELTPGQNFGAVGWTALNNTGGTTGSGGLAYLGNNIFSNNGVVSRTVSLNQGSFQGGISTTISGLISGQTLDVAFDLSRNAFAGDTTLPSILVGVTGLASQSFTLPTVPTFTVPGAGGAAVNLAFTRLVASFAYTGGPTATLSFVSQSGTNIGPIIDNVAVSQVPFEFSPLTGFIAGGVLFGSYKLIKGKKSVA